MKRISSGNIAVITLALIPVALWLIFSPQPTLSLNSAGKLSGLVALALLSINIILSGRLSLFDRLFKGLDHMYRTHHLVGGFTLILALSHANFLILSATTLSTRAGHNLLTNVSSLPLIMGRISLLVLTTAMIIVLYFKVKYQWFITLQRIMGGVLFIAGYHALFMPGSDIRKIMPLLFYMVVLGGLAAAIYVYRSLFHKPLNKRTKYQVAAVKQKGLITEIHLKPLGRRLQHYAGQFVFVSFKSSSISNEMHPFSISSGADSETLRISAKGLGDYTHQLPKLRPGETALLEGPFGNFAFSKIPSKQQTWVAGGIGVTPFLSMAQSIPADTKATLFYSVKTPEEAVYLAELTSIAKAKTNLTVIPIYTDKDGFLSADTIKQHVHTLESVLLCGPPAMMKSLKSQLIKLGVNKHNIYYEEFALS